MSHQLLKDNIETLLSQKKYKVLQVEEKAGLKHGNLSNILSGRSKKPSGEILLAIANVFGVSVEELFQKNSIEASSYLTKLDLTLFLEISSYLIELILEKKLNIHYSDLVSMINEIYEYGASDKEKQLDKKFINWYLQQKYL